MNCPILNTLRNVQTPAIPILTLATAALVSFAIPQPAFPVDKVIVIIGDDHAFHTAEVYQGDEPLTPNLDRLGREGVRLTNAYCNSPICSASRQSLLTGKYPHATGVNLLFTPFPDEGNITIAEHLSDRGFATALVGKSHFNNWAWASLYKDGLPNHGFQTIVDRGDHTRALNKRGSTPIDPQIETYDRNTPRSQVAENMNWRALPHPARDADSVATFYVEEATRFLQDHRDQPFFLWLAFHEPHAPFHFPVEFAGRIDPSEIKLPSGGPEDDRWIPAKYKGLSDEEKRGIVAAYCASTAYLDSNIGKVLDALEALDLDDETLVVYLSDNGYLLNDHKRFEKHTMWEEAVRVPTIFRGAELLSGERSQLVEYVDVAPTLLELMQVDPMFEAQGASFAPLLKSRDASGKPYVFATYLEDNMAMLRTDRWKYVFTTGSRDLGINYRTGLPAPGITHRLYDMENDPRETTNLAGSAEHQETVDRLKLKMIEHFMDTHPDAKDCPDTLTHDGKLVWFCEPRDIGTDQSLEDVPVRVFQSQ